MILEQIETKLDIGLDRSLNAVLGWVKQYLQQEQKKSDFKPETDDFDTIASPVSQNLPLHNSWYTLSDRNAIFSPILLPSTQGRNLFLFSKIGYLFYCF